MATRAPTSLTVPTGNDSYVVDNAADVVVEWSAEGTDTAVAGASYALSDNVERMTPTGTAASNATGNALANTLTVNPANNIINGGAECRRKKDEF